jgi:HKD family nuclease
MKLAKTLIEASEFTHCLILTYNADLLFFEGAVFSELYQAGCRQTIVVMDPKQYSSELADTIPLLRYVGQRYICMSAIGTANACFHPKLVLQVGETSGRLLVGSANLSQPGLTRNLEVMTEFTFTTEIPDATAHTACHWAWRYIRRLAERWPEHLRRKVKQLADAAPWLDSSVPVDFDDDVKLLHNLDESLWSQIQLRVRKPAKRVQIVSPYFDPNCKMFEHLLTELEPQRVTVYVQPNTNNLNPKALKNSFKNSRCHLELRGVSARQRRLHAKAMQIATSTGTWLLTGSANFSLAGLYHSATNGNAEIGVLRYAPNEQAFRSWWAELHNQTNPIDYDDIAPATNSPAPDELPGSVSPLITIVSATVNNEGELRIQFAVQPPKSLKSISVRITSNKDYRFAANTWNMLPDDILAIDVPRPERGKLEEPCLVALQLTMSSGHIVETTQAIVHHLGQLYRYFRPARSAARLPIPDALLPNDQARLLEVLEYFQRLIATSVSEFDPDRHRIKGKRRPEEGPDNDKGDDGYDPEAQIVPEKVRYEGGVGFYRNYDDRLDFRDLLRAALRASYRAPVELRSADEPSPPPPPNDGNDGGAEDDPEVLRQKYVQRIRNGCKRLIQRYEEGTKDSDYLGRIPPSYPIDLFCAITAFLGVANDAQVLDTPTYVYLISWLLAVFYGGYEEIGLYYRLLDIHGADSVQDALEFWKPHAKALVLVYQLWKLKDYPRVRIEAGDVTAQIGVVARYVRREVSGIPSQPAAENLRRAVTDLLAQLWPVSKDRPDYQALENTLREAADFYDRDALECELKTMDISKVEITEENRADRDGVPTLEAVVDTFNLEKRNFLEAFQFFARYYRAQPWVWARFKCGKESLLLFHKDDEKTLTVVAQRQDSEGNSFKEPDIDLSGVDRETLLRAKSLSELMRVYG